MNRIETFFAKLTRRQFYLVLALALGISTPPLLFAFIVGMTYLVKHGSYWLFYEDLVQETIRELVQPTCLVP